METFLHYLDVIWLFIKQWYWIPLTIIYVFVAVTILIENRKPEKTIAWILVIIFVPVIGLIFYFFFGQQFKREKIFTRIDKNQQQKLKEQWHNISSENQTKIKGTHHKIGHFSKIYQYLETSQSSPVYLNDEIKVLKNGEEKFPIFLEAIRQAKHHIHLEYYIFELDTIGQEVIDLLIEKAKQGVEVRVMIDDFGSSDFGKKGYKIFKNTSVKFQVFLPVRFSSLANSNYRNHRKILIVDAQIAFVGGINICDKYINTTPYSIKNTVYWRDTSIQIKGESIDMLQLQFWLNWSATEGDFYDLEKEVYHFPKTKLNTQHPIQSINGFAFTTPGSSVASAMEAMILAISLAKKRVRLTTPYFIPSEEFKSALLIAVSSGVEVELMLPQKGDSFIVQQASLSFLKPLMRRGVKVFLYQKGFVHAKTMIIDDEIAFVGTVNLDNRSFFINFELMSIFHDENQIQKLHQDFEEDLNESKNLTFEKWQEVNLFQRGVASLCRLFAPLL